MIEKIKVTGVLRGVLTGPDGKIKESFEHNNLVVTAGRQHIANQLADQSQGPMTHMAIGSGNGDGTYNGPTAADTALQSEIEPRKLFDSKAQGGGDNANQIIYTTAWGPGDGDGSIVEAGIFNQTSNGIMLCRTTFEAKNKGSGDSLTLTWTITIAGS